MRRKGSTRKLIGANNYKRGMEHAIEQNHCHQSNRFHCGRL